MNLFKKSVFFFVCSTLIYNVVLAQHSVRDTIFVQTDTAFNVLGIPNYYYTRIFEYRSEKPNETVVTFTFSTKKNQAVTYRQETLNGRLEWIDKEGLYKKEGVVEAVTAYLPVNSEITWKYRYISTKPANKIINFDKSALLIMDEHLDVKKIILKEINF